ncbi:hypothetical protein [Sphingobium nicotianae]|uniref:Sulfurtransferase n=1 Tax=Sphingobium nicotianae TaxID=2782607 RepID=A0A9X1IQJ7_9SPHN|nr:hypothetical protein [Sphingobium nicotianae]MBT2186570.1 hypothetical protein [Sphingobium nicotianae]
MARHLIIATLIGMAAASPLAAQPAPADWWLVYGKDGAATVQFIDLAAVGRTATGAHVDILAVDRAGKKTRQAVTIDCADIREARSVPAFVCGTDAYRAQNGLNIRDFPPTALAKIYFDVRASG